PDLQDTPAPCSAAHTAWEIHAAPAVTAPATAPGSRRQAGPHAQSRTIRPELHAIQKAAGRCPAAPESLSLPPWQTAAAGANPAADSRCLPSRGAPARTCE